MMDIPGADPGFQVRGGAALKKIAPSGGREALGYRNIDNNINTMIKI
jgi:hypothetical protein